jgi:DNA-binding NarL/FixJ family response regulator
MSKRGEIEVVLADDNHLIRNGVRNLLCREEDILLVGEARNGAEAVAMIEQFKPHVALLDIEMPVLDGIEAARRLKSGCPGVQIIFLSTYDDPCLIEAIREEGWSGYVIKEQAPVTLIDTIYTFSAARTGI